MRVLILGGTGEAWQLAMKASAIPGIQVIVSLAGRTRQPATVNLPTRIGGFGGIQGLVNYLQENSIDLLIDATHPFAQQISINAVTATQLCGISYLMLVRPAWKAIEGERWIEVDNLQEAANLLPSLAKRVFLTIGKQELPIFTSLQDIWFLMRSIDPPAKNLLIPQGKLLLAKGTFSVDYELELLQKYQIQAIVSKNSGGDATYAKIIAARQLSLPVIMVKRPIMPKCDRVSNLDSALKRINQKSNRVVSSDRQKPIIDKYKL